MVAGRPLFPLGRMMRLGLGDWVAGLVAATELARARVMLYRLDPASFREPAPSKGRLTLAEQAQIDRVSRSIARASFCIPWRSDCLVQAEAARHWLARTGLVGEIYLGARKTVSGSLDAHAWLVCKGCVVTGGDIVDYTPFT